MMLPASMHSVQKQNEWHDADILQARKCTWDLIFYYTFSFCYLLISNNMLTFTVCKHGPPEPDLNILA